MTRFVERENKLSSPISLRAEQAADNEVKIIQGAYRIDMDSKITKMYSTRIQIKDIREQIKSRLKCPYCGYIWDCETSLVYTSCSSCRKGFRPEDNKVSENESK